MRTLCSRLIAIGATLGAVALLQGAVVEAAQLKAVPATPVVLAKVDQAVYCFARPRNLRVESLPPSHLVLRLRLSMTYRNPGTRTLIMPLEHDRKVYMSLAPGTMKPLKEPISLLASSLPVMKHLPADVNPDNPVDPDNDVFTMLPGRSDTTLHDIEEVEIPVYHKGSLRKEPDLRGHKVYLRLKMIHQELDPVLDAVLSDRWTNLGTPWTGSLMSNTLVFDVPASPNAAPCVDKRDAPLHPRAKEDALRR